MRRAQALSRPASRGCPAPRRGVWCADSSGSDGTRTLPRTEAIIMTDCRTILPVALLAVTLSGGCTRGLARRDPGRPIPPVPSQPDRELAHQPIAAPVPPTPPPQPPAEPPVAPPKPDALGGIIPPMPGG